MIGLFAAIVVPLLALHVFAVAVSRALRTYSRSRLEQICARHGRPERADLIARYEEKTERALDALSSLTGLGLAGILGAATDEWGRRMAAEALVAFGVIGAGLGHAFAGVIGRVHAEVILDALWPAATVARILMLPLTALSRGLEALFYRWSRRYSGAPRPMSVEVEIHAPDDETAEEIEADLPEATRELMERAVDLTRRDVSEIMTPASEIVMMPADTSLHEATRIVVETGRSRIPLYGATRDDIVGVLHAKDLFKLYLGETPPESGLAKLAHPVLFVPETKNAAELLEELRKSRTAIAIVLDEYGSVAGLVTLEDLLEEIVGPIDDEHDEPTPPDPIRQVGEGLYEVDAGLDVEEFNERLGLNLPTDEDYSTLGGLVLTAVGRIPEPGTTFRKDGVEFTVLEVADRKITRLGVRLLPAGVSRD